MRRALPIELLSRLVPGDHPVRTAARLWASDLRTLARTFHDWRVEAAAPPRSVYIETTNICTADCVFCAYQFQTDWRKRKGTMSEALFGRALDEIAATGCDQVSFTPIVGDPLVDRHIVRRVGEAVRRGFKVHFYTNGLLLDRLDPNALLDTGLRAFSLSTSPLDEGLHKQLYRSKQYRNLLAGLEALLRARNARNGELRVLLEFRGPLSAEATLALPDFRDRIGPLLTPRERAAIVVRAKNYDSWGGQIGAEDLLPGMTMAKTARLRHRPCDRTLRPQILWDGKVRACSCVFGPNLGADADDGLLIGDLNTQGLGDIWRGDALRRVRARFVERKLPAVCQGCTLYQPM